MNLEVIGFFELFIVYIRNFEKGEYILIKRILVSLNVSLYVEYF